LNVRRGSLAPPVTDQHLREVFHHAPLGICTVSADGRILSANPALWRLLGGENGSDEPRVLADLFHPDAAAVVQAMQRRLLAGEVEQVAIERQFHGGDGAVFWGRLTASVVVPGAGDPRFLVAMVENIDDRRSVDAAMDEINARVESLSRAKSALVAGVSHEFRTALTGIEGFSELLRDRQMEAAEVRELAGDINSEARRLSRLIADLLDLDRLESGTMPLRRRPVDVNAMLTTLADRVRRGFNSHRVTLRLAEALPAVDADPDRLTQVFANLLSNALKYSPAGSGIRVTSKGIDGGVRVAVRDHGPGVPADALELIFDRYMRLERETLSSVVGTGLGLPIVREIVRVHGGRVWAQNAATGGAVFTVELPLAAPEGVHADRVL
jgi:PAS domain S-box-containing protein